MNPKPYYRRPSPKPFDFHDFASDHVDLGGDRHLPRYTDPQIDQRSKANSLFDARAAAVINSIVGGPDQVRIEPRLQWTGNTVNYVNEKNGKLTITADSTQYNAGRDLLEIKTYNGFTSRSENSILYILRAKCLAVMAYADYFPSDPRAGGLRDLVSQAIMKASPGWCGTFGPGVTGFPSLEDNSGDYDMEQVNTLLPLAYSFYDELPDARERLISYLLARGLIQRPNEDESFTSSLVPNDWSRAGYVSPLGVHVDIPETENHVLMIQTVRYLTNQLLYQRDNNIVFDNRRNGDPGDSRPSCTELLLTLLQGYLRDDFAEYNAKPYQEETRWALNNLCSYAYDAEVRLGARMVLEYISAHFAVSSNDLRRLVPFRRRNEGAYVHQLSSDPGFMDTALLGSGADPMAPIFAILAGNTRAYAMPNFPDRPWPWSIQGFPEFAQTPLTDYRISPLIHDLFVNDSHRRFFQRLHRFPHDEPGRQRNCDNMEIYAGSPSYLITAGGRPAAWIIPGAYGFHYDAKNLGIAMPTSFMPTGLSAGLGTLGDLAKKLHITSLLAIAASIGFVNNNRPISVRELLGSFFSQNDAGKLIQFSKFSDSAQNDGSLPTGIGATENYGVAPDFACGYKIHRPEWVKDCEIRDGQFTFVNKKSEPGGTELAGFFLAIHEDGDFALLEAFDTWLHPEVTFDQFKDRVKRANPSLLLANNQESVYTTQNGNRVHFVIWNNLDRDNHVVGSKILNIEYGPGNPLDTLVDGGNDTNKFLSGTVLNSPKDAVVEISNHSLGTRITLDMNDPWHPKRVSETGEVEEGGNNHEVWVDFDWKGPVDGDFFHPFNTLAAALAVVADGGTVKIAPGQTTEMRISHINKQVTLVAVIGGVTIGSH